MHLAKPTFGAVLLLLSLSTQRASCFDVPGAFRNIANAFPTGTARADKSPVGVENGDADYPWRFTGRLWARPALVRVPRRPTSGEADSSSSSSSSSDPPPPPPSVSVLSLFGWTVGGVVALEYDDSPVGPYCEYVTMGAVVSKRGSVGQWGSRLYVSTDVAQRVCEDVWGVPASLADIEFEEGEGGSGSAALRVNSAPDGSSSAKQGISVGGWGSAQISGVEGAESPRYPSGGLPVLWTPTIKALWAPLVLLPSLGDDEDQLPLHRLRLSASGARLRLCGQPKSESLGIPIGIGLVVDNVLIEIARKDGIL